MLCLYLASITVQAALYALHMIGPEIIAWTDGNADGATTE